MKLWVDDVRPAPAGWEWARSVGNVLHMLDAGAQVDEISLDHDMGGDSTTRRIVSWFASHDQWPAIVRVHTQNVVGREWLEGMIERYGPGVTR